MTAVYITVDTEYTSRLPGAEGPGTRAENFSRSIAGRTARGEVGIFYQMDVLERHGLKASFFVDPMPALLWGVDAISDVVRPIVARGHDVQLHCHTEWLAHANGSGLAGGRTGRNLRDFELADQLAILDFARSTLVAAGAPPPLAFRAGNYGANDDTLRALARLGIAFDTSHAPALPAGDCAISLGSSDRAPVYHCGVTEVPVASIGAFGKRLRHGQITALSLSEMRAAIVYARDAGEDSLTLVSHSFELMGRNRARANPVVVRRFEKLCAVLAAMPGITVETYASRLPHISDREAANILPHKVRRTGLRMIEQAIGNAMSSRAG